MMLDGSLSADHPCLVLNNLYTQCDESTNICTNAPEGDIINALWKILNPDYTPPTVYALTKINKKSKQKTFHHANSISKILRDNFCIIKLYVYMNILCKFCEYLIVGRVLRMTAKTCGTSSPKTARDRKTIGTLSWRPRLGISAQN